MHDSTHTIFHSAKRFFGGTMLSRISGMMRDVVMASAFGTQGAIAAFMVAFRLAHLLRRLFGEGAMQSAFIPQFEELRQDNSNRACHFFCNLAALLSVGLLALILFSTIVLGGILLYADLSTGNQEILLLTLILMPSLLFICLFGLNSSLLQCEKSFFTSGVAPVAFNGIWIIGVLCLWHLPEKQAMPWLAVWVIVACLCQWLMTLPRTLSILRQHGMTSLWTNARQYAPDVKRLFKPLFLGIVGVAASQVNNALDAIFARYADESGPALLWYALRLQQLPLALFGIAISGALLPPLTRALKNQDTATYHHFLQFALTRSAALIIPITCAIIVMGDSAVNVIFARGDFNDQSTIGTAQCLWCYGLGLFPMTLVLVLAPAFYATGDSRIPAMASVVSMGVNIALNALLIMGMGYGAASVALSTSFSAIVNVVILAKAMKESRVILSKPFGISLLKLTLISLMAGATTLIVDGLLMNGSTAIAIISGKMPVFFHGVAAVLQLSIQMASFLLSLGLFAWLFKVDDLLSLFRGPLKEEIQYLEPQR